jgi:hypothetical protein
LIAFAAYAGIHVVYQMLRFDESSVSERVVTAALIIEVLDAIALFGRSVQPGSSHYRSFSRCRPGS